MSSVSCFHFFPFSFRIISSFAFCWININDMAVSADMQTLNTNHRFKSDFPGSIPLRYCAVRINVSFNA